MMKTKWILGTVLSLALALVIPISAMASLGGGTGSLTADGNGLACLKGDGQISIQGAGTLSIKDLGGDAEVSVAGKGIKVQLPNGWTRYLGFDGEAQIQGSQVLVCMSGGRIHLEASGHGRFFLRGTGTYEVNGHIGEWTAYGVALEMP